MFTGLRTALSVSAIALAGLAVAPAAVSATPVRHVTAPHVVHVVGAHPVGGVVTRAASSSHGGVVRVTGSGPKRVVAYRR